MDLENIKAEIANLVKQYYLKSKYENITPVRYGGSVHDDEELIEMVNAILDGWWVNGKRTKEFENAFKKYLSVKHSVFCNSGSSALILALESLKLKQGSEVISPALTFPTTINPAIRSGMKVVLVDSDIGTYNINVDKLEQAITNDTKALIIPHLLGNTSDMDRIMDLVSTHNLFLIEDCCEALGSKYRNKMLGSFGDCATFSFFPSHHISAGGGGMFTTNNDEFYLRSLSLKNWGRQYSNIEYIPNQGLIRSDYIQQYTYEEIGYNFNASEIEAAKGIVQMGKINKLNEFRENNFQVLFDFFKKYEDYFILPETTKNAKPAWFAFPLTIKSASVKGKFNREDLMSFLFKKQIETRYILAGNIARQPAYSKIKFKIVGNLDNADRIFKDSFFIGLYPGITSEKMKYLKECFEEFFSTLH